MKSALSISCDNKPYLITTTQKLNKNDLVCSGEYYGMDKKQ